MITIDDFPEEDIRNEHRPLSATKVAILQLAPGLASLPIFALLAYSFSKQNLPGILALALTITLVEMPLSWAIMIRHVRRESGGFSMQVAFPWMRTVSWWQYLVIGLPMVFFSMFLIIGIGPTIEAQLLARIFTWVPGWFVLLPDPGMFASLTQGLVYLISALMLFSVVLAGGVTQELYSRGFLLPRTAHFGWRAPAYNALLFAMMHMIAPWGWPTFFLMTLPWAYLVWWRRSVKIGLFIHVGMLALQWLGMNLVMFGIVPMPA